ncbi:MAG: OmpP1/FadL family transporter, partial [Planctomycetota bacterium]
TAVSEGPKVELRKITFLRTFGQGGKRTQTRTPVADEDIRIEEDPGLSKIILATASGPFKTSSQEEEIWILAEAERFKGQDLKRLILEFRYGFDGGGAKGNLALLLDGKEMARKTLEPKPSLPPGKGELERRRRSVAWMEREKLHLGFGLFTEAWIASGYGNLPSNAGEHEGQLRYGIYSITVGAAIELHPNFAVGASVSLAHGRFFNLDGLFSQPASVLHGFETPYRNVTGQDQVSLQVDTNDLFTWGGCGRAGFLGRLWDDFSVGAAIQSPIFLGRHGGHARVDLTDDFLFSGFDTWLQVNGGLPLGGYQGYEGDYDAYITGFQMPIRGGVGAAYRLFDAVTVAVDGEFIGWSSSGSRMTMKFTRGSNADSNTLTGNTFKIRLPLGLKDQWTAAVGLSADLHPNLTVHLGYRWASSPVKETRAHPLFPGHVQHYAAMGISLKHRALGIHLSVQHGFDAQLKLGTSVHDPLFDKAEFTLRQETAVLGISYEY